MLKLTGCPRKKLLVVCFCSELLGNFLLGLPIDHIDLCNILLKSLFLKASLESFFDSNSMNLESIIYLILDEK